MPNLTMSKSPGGDRLVMSPMEPLVAGGAAEAFERQVQQLFRSGYRNLVVDLSGVRMIDSAGIRALVRGHTTGQRVGGTLRLAAAPAAVANVLEIAHLAGVFEIYDSVEAARIASWPWQTIRVAMAGIVLCGALVWAGLRWPVELTGIGDAAETVLTGTGKKGAGVPFHQFQPFIALLKLIVAALIGLLVTAIHQPSSRDRPRSMEQAQTLLCVSGAMMWIIIGDSLARAFGIAGAASIIRFRTPVDDPKDVTILFLLMGLGMSTGLGAFAVAGLGTAFLCTTLLALDRVSSQKARVMSVEILASGRQFPTTHVEKIFARNQIVFEPREISQADDVTVKYHTWLDPRTSLEDLSVQLMEEGVGVKSVAWEHPKRERA
jgi:anti-anti-sigma factor